MPDIFDGTFGMNPLPWLQEKTLSALKSATRLIDLANEPDTTPWYATHLRRGAEGIIARLAPVVVLLHQADGEAAQPEQWQPVVERGSFALAAWCKKYDIVDPTQRTFDLLAQERSPEERQAKGEVPDASEADEELDEAALGRRLTTYTAISRRMIHEELTEPARRLLLWALSHLEFAERGDVVVLSKRFLPTDIGTTPEETVAAYRLLWERGFIERAAIAEGRIHVLPIRLLGGATEGSKHPLPFSEEEFGYPGARLGGKQTLGSLFLVPLPEAIGVAVTKWKRFSDEALASLQKSLQTSLGAERVFMEEVTVTESSSEPMLRVRLRHTLDDDDSALRAAVSEVTVAWLRERIAPKS